MSILDRCESRDGYAVRVLAVHTSEGGGTAASLRDADWWVGSSHAICDDRTLLTPAQGCVPYSMAAWTLRSGNRWSENIEQIGYAAWSRSTWLNDHAGTLDNTARWLAARSKARGIPLVKLTPAQYRAGQKGVIGHVDHTIGYSDGSHWDPGPNYPWDVVIAKARAYANPTPEDALMAVTEQEFDNVAERLIRVEGKVNALVDALLDREYQRTGVLPEDTVQVATLPNLVRYADGNALKARRCVEADQPPAA